jgi:hypothetical protein
MEPKWTDIVQALAACGALVVAVVGLRLVLRQLRQVERTIRGNTYATLCQQSLEILKSIESQPESYAYFYDNRPLAENDSRRIEILCVTEMIANYLDMVALQRENMPSQVWKYWKNFIVDTVRRSEVVRNHLKNFANWYSEELNAIVKNET